MLDTVTAFAETHLLAILLVAFALAIGVIFVLRRRELRGQRPRVGIVPKTGGGGLPDEHPQRRGGSIDPRDGPRAS